MGRALFLPVTAEIQSAIQRSQARKGRSESLALLLGLQSVEWFCVACMGTGLLLTIFDLRRIGKIGVLKKLGNVQSASNEKDGQA